MLSLQSRLPPAEEESSDEGPTFGLDYIRIVPVPAGKNLGNDP